MDSDNHCSIKFLIKTVCPDVPNFIKLLYITPDDFTCQGESAAATQWVSPFRSFVDDVQ